MDKVEEADKSKSSRYALCSVLRMTWSGFNGGLLEALQPKMHYHATRTCRNVHFVRGLGKRQL